MSHHFWLASKLLGVAEEHALPELGALEHSPGSPQQSAAKRGARLLVTGQTFVGDLVDRHVSRVWLLLGCATSVEVDAISQLRI